MVYEHLRLPSEQPSWTPYLNVLPTHFDTLMYWTDEELQELQASPVLNKIGKKEADKDFEENLVPIIRNNPEVFHDSSLLTHSELMQLLHRMATLIHAYAFDLENDSEQGSSDLDDSLDSDLVAMVPFADMLNADADQNNVRKLYQSQSNAEINITRQN
jgi:N-lysine methyltransferase SETD6